MCIIKNFTLYFELFLKKYIHNFEFEAKCLIYSFANSFVVMSLCYGFVEPSTEVPGYIWALHLWTPPHLYFTLTWRSELAQAYIHRHPSLPSEASSATKVSQVSGAVHLKSIRVSVEVSGHGYVLYVTLSIYSPLMYCEKDASELSSMLRFSFRWQCMLFVLAVSRDGSAVCCVSLGLRHHWL